MFVDMPLPKSIVNWMEVSCMFFTFFVIGLCPTMVASWTLLPYGNNAWCLPIYSIYILLSFLMIYDQLIIGGFTSNWTVKLNISKLILDIPLRMCFIDNQRWSDKTRSPSLTSPFYLHKGYPLACLINSMFLLWTSLGCWPIQIRSLTSVKTKKSPSWPSF
jgi:hypothetical protein